MTLRLTAIVAVVLTTLTFGAPTLAPGQAVRTDPNGSYQATGRLVVRGRDGVNERVNASLELDGKKLRVQQTNGRRVRGTLRMDDKAGSSDTKVNTDLRGNLKANGGDAGRLTKGKLKVKTTRSGGFSLNVNARGKVTRGDSKGNSFSFKVKGSSF